ncbi:hypothetical protein ACFUTV_43625 [Streptomyces sp. NPDC057298]|uniref:hypothetical protein n=1 Tax=Streptomyces sp. NPDC057298 TaxID=3346091 RepID=UPI003640E839
MAFWTDHLDHAALHDECVAVLRGEKPSEDYLSRLVRLALAQLSRVLENASPIRRHNIILDEQGDVTAASVSADGSLYVSQRFLRDVAERSLDLAWELGRLLHLSYVGTDDGPVSYVSAEDFVNLALDCEESRLDGDRYSFELHERIIVGTHRQLRGAVPAVQMPVLPASLLRPVARVRAEDNRDPGMYVGENGRYATRLYHHIVLNVLLYTFAHEAGHLTLGHAGERIVSSAPRSREVDADVFALSALHTVAGQADLRPAISVFRIVHDRRPGHLPDYSLSHPSSGERLQALAAVVESNPAYRRLVPEMDEALRGIRTQLPAEFGVAGAATSSVWTFSDTEAAYIEFVPAPAVEEDFAARDGLPTCCRVLYHGIREATGPHASADVLCTLRRGGGESYAEVVYERNDSGEPVATVRPGGLRYHARITVPPAWRHAWPDGLLRVAEVRHADRPVERSEWVTEEGGDLAPMASLLAAIDEGHVGVREVSGWVGWCLEQGREHDANFLNSRAVRKSPFTAGYSSAMAEIHRLADLELFDDAESIARRFLAQADRGRPGLFQICGVAAFHRGEYREALDGAFLEMNGFGPKTKYSEAAIALLHSALDALNKVADGTGDDTALRTFFHIYGERPWFQLRRGRVRRLRTAISQLESLSAGMQDTVTVLQLRAEVLRDIGVLTGNAQELEEAAQLLRGVVARAPGFTPGWVQLAHVLLDLGRGGETAQCLARAEELGPSSPQVRDLELRVLRARR